MAKENTKSPLKQGSDKRYNRQTYTGMGTSMQDRLIKGAYISARADAPDYSWMNVIGAGVKAFKSEMDTKQAVKDAQREGDLGKIEGITDKIYATGGSLPESYYNQAYDYTEMLREKYIAAVASGNKKEELKVKGQLNMFAASIGTVKDNIIQTAEMWKDDALVNPKGMTPEQISINKSLGEDNAEINMEDGTFSWRNVDYIKGGEGYLGKEFFTPEDLKGALPLRDDVNTEGYKESNKSVLERREKWLNGEVTDFDNKTYRDANIKLIDKSIKDVGSMQSFIWDDITGFGSFADTIEDHPDFVKYFEEDLPLFNTKDGLKNMISIGLYDKDKNGSVGYEDFIDPTKNPEFDLNRDGVVTAEELSKAIELNPILGETIKGLVKPKIKNAILNPPKGQEDLTKGLLADFMTNRQRQMFYGDGDEYKNLVPNGDNVKYTAATKKKKGTLIINGSPIESMEAYLELGGSYGYLKSQGYHWDPKDGGWLYNKGTQFYSKDPVPKRKKLDD